MGRKGKGRESIDRFFNECLSEGQKARILWASCDMSRAYTDRPLGRLVRTVVGLDRNAAKAAFAEFLSEAPLHPDQISFLDEVVNYLVKNGIMEPKAMFDTPFTNINDQGVLGVFGEKESRKIVETIQQINRNADVA